ncbi:hypothetical protein ACFVS7_03080 [Streptomyces rubiginosohelvolus]|nr:hypothetical protein [Streptomyces sp. SID6648]
MRVVLTKTVGLVAAAVLALGCTAVLTLTDGTQAAHRIAADHKGPTDVTP